MLSWMGVYSKKDKGELKMSEFKKRILFVDYAPIEGCVNPDTYGAVCVQCNQCGRFDEKKESENAAEVERED